jgi:hypothetical protein
MPRLYLHCGLHKTGTTSVQHFMMNEAETLARAGVLYPKTGRPWAAGGQHNLAWQLTKDRRYSPEWGNLDALAAEIDGFTGDVVLSSEDFESLLVTPDGLRPLAELAAAGGRTLTPILYVRHQADYLESLYYQCLKAGFAEEYAGFVSEAVERGEVRRHEWRFVFDFGRALESLGGVAGGEVRVRNYHVLERGSVIRDLLGVIGVPASLFSDEALTFRAHEREPLLMALARFYYNRVQRDLSRGEKQAVRMLGAHLDAAAAPPPVEVELANAFVFSNKALCRRYGLPEAGLVRDAGPAKDQVADLAKVFSLETQLTISQLAEELGQPEAAAGQAQAKARAWRQWLSQA